MAIFDAILKILNGSLVFMIPLLIVALGGMFAEKSGVVNIALEGIMVFGSFAGVIFIRIMQDNTAINPQLLLLLALIVSALFGMLFSCLLGLSAINLKADQTIGGTAMNMFAPALTVYVARAISHLIDESAADSKNIKFVSNFKIRKIPLLGDIPIIGDIIFKDVFLTTYLVLAFAVVAWYIINRSRFGLRLSACGEHPQAADSLGINVYRYRWSGVLISGALAGIGGLIFVVSSSVAFTGTVAGYGFLAIAVLIFGQWKPLRILLAALFFGLMNSFAYKYTLLPFLADVNIGWFFKMVPFIATILVLIFTSKKSRAPKAVGIPYDMGKR